MNIHNFQLSNVFRENAKEYFARPVMAAKYQPGMENGWMVYFESKPDNGKYYGIRFFPTKKEANTFIRHNEKQYAKEHNELIEIDVEYDSPLPVLCRKDSNMEKLDGIDFCFGDKAFVSDESKNYEFYILDSNYCDSDTWIIQDMMNGNIRVWDNTSDELFFGKESEYIFEKIDKEKYRQVTV